MEINDLDLKNYKDKLIRQISRNKVRIKEYEDNKNNLSVHGHWSLGYYIGVNSELEKLLDDIDTLFKNS